jgi:hypothetical protein
MRALPAEKFAEAGVSGQAGQQQQVASSFHILPAESALKNYQVQAQCHLEQLVRLAGRRCWRA